MINICLFSGLRNQISFRQLSIGLLYSVETIDTKEIFHYEFSQQCCDGFMENMNATVSISKYIEVKNTFINWSMGKKALS